MNGSMSTRDAPAKSVRNRATTVVALAGVLLLLVGLGVLAVAAASARVLVPMLPRGCARRKEAARHYSRGRPGAGILAQGGNAEADWT